MRFIIFLIGLILTLLISIPIEAKDCFAHKLPRGIMYPVEQEFAKENNRINVSSLGYVSSLTITGHVSLNSRNSLVRIILVDSIGYEYLLFEKRYFIQDQKDTVFEDSAFETAFLDNVKVEDVKVVVKDAIVYVKYIKYQKEEKVEIDNYREFNSIRIAKQCEINAAKWNINNKLTNVPWIADVTPLSILSYSEKKKIFHIEKDDFDTYGLEFYCAGYFIVPSNNNFRHEENSQQLSSMNFVDHFDWRNRHGKNWLTPVKSQIEPNNPVTGNNGCWVFGACACVESRLNLNYNRLLNVDLSEQEIAVCSPYGGTLSDGGFSYNALHYIKDSNVVTEDCFPFYNDQEIDCSFKCLTPVETISINDYYIPICANENFLKYELIHNGPFASGMENGHTNHVMCLCGYGTIRIGDTITYVPKNQNPHIAPYQIIINDSSQYIGQTYWIFKNSYGVGVDDGYFYAVFENASTHAYCAVAQYPIRTSILLDSDILVTDDDNDGYYFWGLGEKPSHCPVCCPDIPDGDDSNPSVGQMDEYGNFVPYQFPYPTDTLSTSQTWSTNRQTCNNIVITNHSYLSISGSTLTMNPAAKIIVKSGCGMVLTNATIDNANIVLEGGGSLYMLSGSVINTRGKGQLDVQQGGVLNMSNNSSVITN